MAQVVQIHPVDPQPRLIAQVVAQLHKGAVLAYPTDSSYALGCHVGDKAAMERIRRLRGFGKDHHMTLLCSDLSQVAAYCKLDNVQFRMLKAVTPGAYTFILPATHETPRRLQSKRKNVGVRIPDNAICQALIEALGEPLMTCTALLPDDDYPLADPDDVMDALDKLVDVIVDGGNAGLEPTTVVDLTGTPEVTRAGKGDVAALGLE
ncbi:threonylcarbamoyl-AMP synthase [bacterium]|nr:threonylcarbamoyl-AMP synthase [bacterium]